MNKWTVEEISILKSNYNKVSNDELLKLLPDKTFLAIYKKAYKMGMRKSKDNEFLNRSNVRKGDKSSNWKGGISKSSKGYRLILKPNHHRADSKGYVLEHILIFEEKTGLQVPDNCCIHHLNGDKTDNRIENLSMMLTSAHTSFHNAQRKLSEETKNKISEKAKERFKSKENHPFYKNIDITSMFERHKEGYTIKEICKEYGISRSTYYSKIKELEKCE